MAQPIPIFVPLINLLDSAADAPSSELLRRCLETSLPGAYRRGAAASDLGSAQRDAQRAARMIGVVRHVQSTDRHYPAVGLTPLFHLGDSLFVGASSH